MLRFHAQTDTGNKRTLNEDRLWPSEAPHPYEYHEYGQLFVIADGMGGAGAGDIASQTAIDTIFRVYYASDNPHTDVSLRLDDAVHTAHQAICQKATESPAWQKMGTTVVAAIVKIDETNQWHLWVAWAGDSRAYHWSKADGLRRVTTDHSRIQEIIDTGAIPWEELHFHPQRSTLTNSLTAQRTTVEISHTKILLSPGDQILLCSDGLTSEVHDDAIARVLAESTPDKAAAALIQRAKAPKQWVKDDKPVRVQGGGDNISVVIVSIARNTPRPYRWLVGAAVAGLGMLLMILVGTVYSWSTTPATPTLSNVITINNVATATNAPEVASTVTRAAFPVPTAVQPTVTLLPTSAMSTTQLTPQQRTKRIQLSAPPNNYELQVTNDTILTVEWTWNAMGTRLSNDEVFVFLVSKNDTLATAERYYQVTPEMLSDGKQRYSFTAQAQDLGFISADTAQVYYWWIGIAQADSAEIMQVSHQRHTLIILPD